MSLPGILDITNLREGRSVSYFIDYVFAIGSSSIWLNNFPFGSLRDGSANYADDYFVFFDGKPITPSWQTGLSSRAYVTLVAKSDNIVEPVETFFLQANGLRNIDWVVNIASAPEAISEVFSSNKLLESAVSTTEVVASTYQFFTGSIPEAEGFAYLISSPLNSTDLNDAYYSGFNTENRYLNFAANLGLFGSGAEAFKARYGGLSVNAAIDQAYDAIVGFSNAAVAGNDTTTITSFFKQSVSFYKAVAEQRILPSNPNVSLDDATKVVAIGSIINEAMKADLGWIAKGYSLFEQDLASGLPKYGASLIDYGLW